MKTTSVITSLLLAFSASSKDFNNGCSSGWNEKLVPDRVRALGVDFTKSCKNHDNCYSKCLPGGELTSR